MCRAKNGELLTNKNQVLVRWKEHFEEHLNEGSEPEQPTRPVDLRDDGVDIDLPSREEHQPSRKNPGVLLRKYSISSIHNEIERERRFSQSKTE
jgi:hypothetical protein